MNTRIRFFITLLFINTLTTPEAKAGTPAAYAACILSCELACAGGLAITAGVALPAYLACAAGCPAYCAPSIVCFSEDTKLMVSQNGREVSKGIAFVHPGDMVKTLSDGNPHWTKVIGNIKTEGSFDFLQLSLRNETHILTEQLTVTPEHGMIFSNNGRMTLNKASHVQVGDQMISAQGTKSIMSVKPVQLDNKYTLLTTDGTVLASDIFVSTICSEEIDGGEKLFKEKMENWRNNHPSFN